ncbi:MAG TPA: CoA transferase, partial [Acidimicrobiales bacterium]|nr:CoA transferase [Acidimicrobiales bacterium]
EACAQTTDWGLTSYSFIRRFGAYAETRNGGGPIYNVYPCKDGFVRASVVTPREWHRIREWLGDPEFLMDPHWDTNASRIEARDVIEPLYCGLFADQTKIELSAEGQRRGLGITPLLEPGDVLRAAHFEKRGAFVTMPVIDGVEGPVANGLVSFDGDRAGIRTPAPAAPGPALGSGSPLPWAARPDDGAGKARAGRFDAADADGYPFRGLRVLDFGVAGAAPEVARLLAEYGADSIRVESRLRPDLFRVIMGTEMSAVFASSNRSKRSFGVVDFRNSESIEVIKDLIARSDVLVENLPPGTMEQMGLGWDEVHEANPAMIMLSSQLMGSGGPWEDWRGYGANTQPVGGLTHLWSFPDTDPVGANVAFPDHVVGRLGTAAVLAALLERERTGVGRHIEIAQVEVVLNMLADLYVKEALEPGSVGPEGNEKGRGCPWNVYPCAGEQRWCVVTCRDDEDWASVVEALGRPDWAVGPALRTVDGRRAARRMIDERLSEWTSARSDQEVMETLQRHGVPAGRMMYISDMPEDPHLQARGYIRELDQPGLGPVLFEGPAFYGDALPDVDLYPAPELGQHTRELARDLLGLDDESVTKLVERGVLYEPGAEAARG